MQPDEMSGWGNGNGLAGFGGVGGGGSRHANCPTCLHMRFLFFFFAHVFSGKPAISYDLYTRYIRGNI